MLLIVHYQWTFSHLFLFTHGAQTNPHWNCQIRYGHWGLDHSLSWLFLRVNWRSLGYNTTMSLILGHYQHLTNLLLKSPEYLVHWGLDHLTRLRVNTNHISYLYLKQKSTWLETKIIRQRLNGNIVCNFCVDTNNFAIESLLRRLENGKRPQQKTMESFKLASLIIAEQQKFRKFSVQLPSQ